MKHFLSFFIAFVIVTGSAFAVAPDSRFSVLNAGKLVKVCYKSGKETNVKIRIINEKSQEVYAETIQRTSGFIRPYNLSSLPKGNYTVLMSDGGEWIEEKISIEEKEEAKAKGVFHIIRIADQKNKFLVMIGAGQKHDVNINVYDRSGNVIHTEKRTANAEFAEMLNLEKIDGAFTIELSDSNGASKSYSYN